MKEIKLTSIWQASEHNAFTDLTRFNEAWWCTFREAESHNSTDGTLRLLKSSDGSRWQDMGCLRIDNADLRDPKLSVSPSNQLILIATAYYTNADPKYRQTFAWRNKQGEWSEPTPIAEQSHWLWRITWHQDKAYGLAYGTRPKNGLHWYEISPSLDSYKSRRVTEFDGNYVNEHGLVFDEQGTAYCLLRRDITPPESSTGLLGTSKPPYDQWQWQDLGFRIGGPELVWAPDKKTLLAGYRRHEDPSQWLPQWTEIAELSLAGKVLQSIHLESGGDCSYPGLALDQQTLKAVYYSSHDGHCKIYCSDIEMG
ncbi:hypothetical protein MAQ5080_00285 [Marinomonas aquimarina]|uniref:Exo-alpha-sialidase n=1 Tax=Marinomonas aquimarina TaxID=295068 RepID=A0A1A8T2G8_9GAMM|nr:hypothetical protein [Marinomonas aquimarina]SBS25516.1 hypothetical protein MAQ5080_00285 [Marinomonas aquimarina]